jgi:hypothetical protein
MMLLKEKTYIDNIIKNTMNTEQTEKPETETTKTTTTTTPTITPAKTTTTDKKKRFNFKEYYANNPEFRERHLQKMKEKVRCDCGLFVGKYQLTKHKRTKGHATQMEHLLKHTEGPQ